MYHIVINPASRSGKGKQSWNKARPYFKQSGQKFKVYFSRDDFRIKDICAFICNKYYRPDIIIMGGDGTLNEALNGIPDLSAVRLGFIPIGSGNDYAKDAGLSKDIKKSVESIISGNNIHSLDIGRITWTSAGPAADKTVPAEDKDPVENEVPSGDGSHADTEIPSDNGSSSENEALAENEAPAGGDALTENAAPAGDDALAESEAPAEDDALAENEVPAGDETAAEIINSSVHSRYFIISTGIGFDAAICYHVDHSRLKKVLNRIRLGKLTYLIESVKIISTIRKNDLKVELNDKNTYEFKDCILSVCMNHRYEGGGFMFAPDADPADGILDLVITTGLGRLRSFMLFPLAYNGRHKGREGIVMLKGKKISISSELPMYIHTDGEVPDITSSVRIEILPKALTMLN